MRDSFRSGAVVAFAIAWFVFSVAQAVTVIPPTFEEMADRADLIFVGQVVGSRAEWRTEGSNRVIFTMVGFEAQDVLKGSTGKNVTLQFLGGTLGDVTLEVVGVPRFSPRERVILFVEKNGVQFCPLVGVFHGKFGLRKDQKTQHDLVIMHDGKPLRDVAEIGASEGVELAPKRAKLSIPADLEPMSLDAFKSKIHDHLLKRPGQQQSK